nr:PREDICTED: uncharacterized protein LOC106702735 [Latimeria chalumnae]|eukprot:XP_014341297.1 PREDICTED: uncharacterized protein LOC106702735 [Latimeria chalumnae]
MYSNMTRRKNPKINSEMEFLKENSETGASWHTADSAMRREIQKDATAGMQSAEIPTYVENMLEKLDHLTASINKLTNTVEELKTDNKRYWKHLIELEQRTGEIEEEQAKDKKHIAALDAKITSLAQKLDDQENRARRNNLRILGFPEQIEQVSMLFNTNLQLVVEKFTLLSMMQYYCVQETEKKREFTVHMADLKATEKLEWKEIIPRAAVTSKDNVHREKHKFSSEDIETMANSAIHHYTIVSEVTAYAIPADKKTKLE